MSLIISWKLSCDVPFPWLSSFIASCVCLFGIFISKGMPFCKTIWAYKAFIAWRWGQANFFSIKSALCFKLFILACIVAALLILLIH